MVFASEIMSWENLDTAFKKKIDRTDLNIFEIV